LGGAAYICHHASLGHLLPSPEVIRFFRRAPRAYIVAPRLHRRTARASLFVQYPAWIVRLWPVISLHYPLLVPHSLIELGELFFIFDDMR
jgi:hypothetical protein